MRTRLLYILVVSLVMPACSVKTIIHKGQVFEQQGNYEEAANYYYAALLKKPAEKEAQDGLKRSAQQVLNDKFSLFSKYVVDNKVEDAVKQYKNAERYAKVARDVGVNIDWHNEFDEVYLDVRDEYVLGLYDQALRLFKDKKFDAAEQQFQRIAEFDSTYKDATILRLNTVLEPLYQRGLRQITKGQFKEADISFERIIEIDDGYKDAVKLRETAKESASISLAVFPVLNKVSESGDEVSLNELIPRKLEKKNKNPYLKFSKTDEFFKTIESRGWQKVEEPIKAAEAGRNLGYRYVLLVQVIVDFDTLTPYSKIVRDAYEAFTESILNPITNTYNYITKFRKVNFDDSYESRKVKFRVAYQLVNSADGRVVLSDELEQEKWDEVHLYSYSGNINNLYPDLPTGNYLPPPNEAWRDQFTKVKRKLLTKEELGREINFHFAEIIAGAVLPKLK
ncbi:MAG: tetratricopeptide repeat protein [Bacteroidia bacterium]